jgi:ArsR family transcriptional regulator
MEKAHKQYTENAELLKVLAHPVRLCIVKGLLENGECNVTYMQACLDTPQSTVSQHIQKLKAAGVIEGRREGLEIYYKVCNEKAVKIIKAIFQS